MEKFQEDLKKNLTENQEYMKDLFIWNSRQWHHLCPQRIDLYKIGKHSINLNQAINAFIHEYQLKLHLT